MSETDTCQFQHPCFTDLLKKTSHLWGMTIFPTSLANHRGHITNEMVIEGEGSRKDSLKRAECPLCFSHFQWPECKHGGTGVYILQPFADLKDESHSPKMPEQEGTGARVTNDIMDWIKISAFGNVSQILLSSKKKSKYTTCIIGHNENKNNKYQNLDDIAKSIFRGKFIALNLKMKVNVKHFIQTFN